MIEAKRRRKKLMRELEDKAIEEGDYPMFGVNMTSSSRSNHNGGRKQGSNFNMPYTPR